MSPVKFIHACFVLVSVDREAQRLRREKIGALYSNPHHVFLKQNMQHGRIELVGEDVARQFPEAVVGATAIFHHCIEGSMQGTRQQHVELNERFIIIEDETTRYYAVPFEYLYAVDNGMIITSKDFVFGISIENDERELTEESGFYSYKNWKDRRSIVDQRLENLKQEALVMARSSGDKVQTYRRVQELEREMESITRTLNKKAFHPFEIKVSNKVVDRLCDGRAKDFLAFYSMIGEAPTSIEYNGIEYSVIRTRHIGYVMDQKK